MQVLPSSGPVNWAAWTEHLSNPHLVLELWRSLHLLLDHRAHEWTGLEEFGVFNCFLFRVAALTHVSWLGSVVDCVILGGIHFVSMPSSSEYERRLHIDILCPAQFVPSFCFSTWSFHSS